jgi:hypothetical protein
VTVLFSAPHDVWYGISLAGMGKLSRATAGAAAGLPVRSCWPWLLRRRWNDTCEGERGVLLRMVLRAAVVWRKPENRGSEKRRLSYRAHKSMVCELSGYWDL